MTKIETIVRELILSGKIDLAEAVAILGAVEHIHNNDSADFNASYGTNARCGIVELNADT